MSKETTKKDSGSRKFAVIGSGGREDAMVKALSGSKENILIAMPGNYGTRRNAKNLGISSVVDFADIAANCLKSGTEIIVVGPEDPLVAGIVQYFDDDESLRHIKVVGPSAYAARLEGSKSFAKEFMRREGIPTAAFASFTDIASAKAYVDSQSLPIVIKASGLALGKGVTICHTREEAYAELDAMMHGGKFGKAGEEVVIEEFLKGEEISAFVLTDGLSFQLLPYARDHKRIGEGDTGDNTGGMGAVSTPDLVSAELSERIKTRIIQPTLQGMKKMGMTYRGFLYVGLMIVNGDPYVIEYNCRMGDPETQAVLPLLKTDFGQIMAAVADKKLSDLVVEIRDQCSAVVALVSEGYPGAYEIGKKISLDKAAIEMVGCKILYGGVTESDGELFTRGGRVLYLQATAPTLREALAICYHATGFVHFEGMNFRSDIGTSTLQSERQGA